MKDMGIVQGSVEQAQELIVGVDTVYVHTNIVAVNEDSEGNQIDGLYQYKEVQYGKDEYIKLMAEQNKENQAILNTLLGVNGNE